MFSCEPYTAFLYERGGKRQLGVLEPLDLVDFERRRDDFSLGSVRIKAPTNACKSAIQLMRSIRHELVIFRGRRRMWDGVITRITYDGDSVEIEARDVPCFWAQATIMRAEYDNRYPDNTLVLDRLERVMRAEMARKEALDPAVNVVAHLEFIKATAPSEDAGTAAHTLPYEMTVFEHLDTYAARGGIDYTVVGRKMVLFDVHTRLGMTPTVTAADFIGDVIVTEYGMETASYVAMTDGKGNFGAVGGTDDFYGEVEKLHQAYDEDAQQKKAEDQENTGDVDAPPSVAEMQSQARRLLEQGKVAPLVVRIPDNTRVNPNGVLSLSDLVPGTWVPLAAQLPHKNVTQMQKIDSVSFRQDAKGEEIKLVLSPAYAENTDVEEA